MAGLKRPPLPPLRAAGPQTGKGSSFSGGGGAAIRAECRLLKRSIAFALLLLLVPLNPPASGSGGGGSEGGEGNGLGGALFGSRRPRERASSGARTLASGTMLVSAIYLEEVSRFSQVMSNFVDSLLDKVSFLAEIVIESSMDEQCELPAGGQCANQGAAAATAGAAAGAGGAPGGDGAASPRWMNTTIGADDEDGRPSSGEARAAATLGRVKSVLQQLPRAEFLQQGAASGAAASGGGSGGGSSGGCKFLGLPLKTSDLPVAGMENCCSEFELCYSRCGQLKVHCDQELRNCMKRICKQKFDHTNGTLVIELSRKLARERNQASLEPLAADIDLEDEGDDDDGDADDEAGQDHRGRSGRRQREPNERELKLLREKYKACKLAGKVLLIGNFAFGCRNYKQLQGSACCARPTTGAGRPN